MSQMIICPECGHKFNALDRSEYFENLAAQMTKGIIAPKQTCGYDVIDHSEIKYQVKYSILNRKSNMWGWSFRFRIGGNWPDYFILYGVDGEDIFCFLISFRKFYEMSSKLKHSTWLLTISKSLTSRIWDYRVTPDTFDEKLRLLISIGEFTMSLEGIPGEVCI